MKKSPIEIRKYRSWFTFEDKEEKINALLKINKKKVLLKIKKKQNKLTFEDKEEKNKWKKKIEDKDEKEKCTFEDREEKINILLKIKKKKKINTRNEKKYIYTSHGRHSRGTNLYVASDKS